MLLIELLGIVLHLIDIGIYQLCLLSDLLDFFYHFLQLSALVPVFLFLYLRLQLSSGLLLSSLLLFRLFLVFDPLSLVLYQLALVFSSLVLVLSLHIFELNDLIVFL